MGILEFRDSVTFPAFSGEFSQQHLPFRVAPALVFVEIVGQLPRERAAVEVEISRFVHAVQLSGQIVLVVVALAAVRQRPVEGAVGVHPLGPDAEYKGRRLAVAVLLHPDGTVVVELDDFQRAGLLFAVFAQRGAVVLLVAAAAVGAGELFGGKHLLSFLLLRAPVARGGFYSFGQMAMRSARARAQGWFFL